MKLYIAASLICFMTIQVIGVETFSHKSNSVLVGQGRYVFGKLTPNESAYLLDTKTGRLWKHSETNGVNTMVPVIFKTIDNEIKLRPEDSSSVAHQEVQLKLEKEKAIAASKEKNQKQHIAKQAVLSYLKFISKTELLHKEIVKLLKAETINEHQKKMLNKSLVTQQDNIRKIQIDLKKLQQVKNPEFSKVVNSDVLNKIEKKLNHLSANCNKLKLSIVNQETKAQQDDKKL